MLHRALSASLLAVLAVATLSSAAADSPQSGSRLSALEQVATTSAAWAGDDGTPVRAGSEITGKVDVPPGTDRVVVRLKNAYLDAVPPACQVSTIVHRVSYTTGPTLVCVPKAASTRIRFHALAAGSSPQTLTGDVHVTRGQRVSRVTLPPRRLGTGDDADLAPLTRLVSSPDFTNADIADLRRGPNFWSPRRSTNSINAHYRHVLARVLDDWQAMKPAGVLVAGDLANGRWGYDDQDTGNFGPVGTLAQSKAAVRRAAETVYPQFLARFHSRGLHVFPAPGDHDYGDNPWFARKRRLITTFRSSYARYFTAPGRDAHLADHPKGPAATTAYAGRPSPDVQVISIDVFDFSGADHHIRVDKQQLHWIKGVLKRAQRDHVRWIVVQGHVPILTPVRLRHSSGLTYEGGTASPLWHLFKKYGVDLYLDGEVHDVTLRHADGITQVSHGGAFKFGLTNALVMDFYRDHIFLALRDYDIRHRKGGLPNLWESRRGGMDAEIDVHGAPFVIGTAQITEHGLQGANGILKPVNATTLGTRGTGEE